MSSNNAQIAPPPEPQDTLLTDAEIGNDFMFGSPGKGDAFGFSPLRPFGRGEVLGSPFSMLEAMSPLTKQALSTFGNGAFTPGLTPLIGQPGSDNGSNLPQRIPNLVDGGLFGMGSPASSPSRFFGYSRMASARRIDFADGDNTYDALSARFQAPPSLTTDGSNLSALGVGGLGFDADPNFVDAFAASDMSQDPLDLSQGSTILDGGSLDGSGLLASPSRAPPVSRLAPPRKKPQQRPKASQKGRQDAGNGDDAGLISPPPQAAPRNHATPPTRAQAPSEATPAAGRKPTPCNCKKSKCLKLYCECFANNRLCTEACNCSGCCNGSHADPARAIAVQATLDRNPNAFLSRLVSAEVAETAVEAHPQTKGCHCKKSGCLKKYCECFQAGVVCGSHCKCLDCQNCDGNVKLHEARRTQGKKTKRPGGTKAADGTQGGSDGSPPVIVGRPVRAGVQSMDEGEEGTSVLSPPAAVRASSRPPKRTYDILGNDYDFDNASDYEDDADVIVPPPVAHNMFRPGSTSAPKAKPAGGMKTRDRPPAASPADGARPNKPATRKRTLKQEQELADIVNLTAPPLPLLPSVPEPHGDALALPSRKWPETRAFRQAVALHRTFGVRNPGVSDLLVTTIFSYIANEDVYNASLVCTAWASLAMDSHLWCWDGVAYNTAMVVPSSLEYPQFDVMMLPMSPQRPNRATGPLSGLPFLYNGEDAVISSVTASPVNPPGREPLMQLSSLYTPIHPLPALGADAVRMSIMSPLLSQSPDARRFVAPPLPGAKPRVLDDDGDTPMISPVVAAAPPSVLRRRR